VHAGSPLPEQHALPGPCFARSWIATIAALRPMLLSRLCPGGASRRARNRAFRVSFLVDHESWPRVPDAVEPGLQRVLTHRNRGFMAFCGRGGRGALSGPG